jgi:hypothetical protein
MKKIALIILVAVLFLTSVGIVYATLGNKTITITYRNISIYINGVKKVPSNEPFIYNSSTYVPLRFVSEALDKEVKWDGTNNRIDINDKSSSTGEWKKVIEFTGGDSVKTQPFTIHSKMWKVVFTGQQIGDYGAVFDFYVYKVGEDNFIDSATGTFKDKKLSNETYIYTGNSNFYLDISALYCTYDIIVYEQQ